MKALDLVGQRFGRLLVVARAENSKRGQTRFNCVCDCGEERNVATGNLRSGISRSCGCLTKETARARRTTHGLTKTPEYRAWSAMRNRCTNPKAAYAAWNGRGIKVCQRWELFENFLADVGLRPSRAHSIDRIDVDGDYEPSNVRWATRSQQANNMRKTVKIHGEPMTDVALRVGLKPATLYARITRYGFGADEAVALPRMKNQYDRETKKQRVVRRSV